MKSILDLCTVPPNDKLAVDQLYLTEVIYERLVAAFIHKVIRPGDRLMLKPLAERLQVSPTPLRQALCRMESEGLVTVYPRRGIYVTQLTPNKVRELFDIRRLCELLAVERAVCNSSEKELEHMERLATECDECLSTEHVSPLNYARKDLELHSFLVSLTGNTTLQKWYANFRVQMLVLIHRPEITIERASATRSEHRAIIEALKQKEMEKSKEAISSHLDRACKAAMNAL